MRALLLLAFAGCSRQPPLEPLVDKPPEASRVKASRIKAPPDPPWPHSEHRSPKVERADLSPIAARLSEVRSFALGGVGITGATSQGENLTIALAREPDALVMFERLAVEPNRAARLYAYWALRTLDPSLARRYRLSLAYDATVVETASGCHLFRATTAKLASNIDKLPQRAMPKP